MNTKYLFQLLLSVILISGTAVVAQETSTPAKKQVVIITGVRFSYPLVQRWIDDYNHINPDVQVIIESRGTNDPKQYDILAEAYEQSEDIQKTRAYAYVARYAVIPVANSQSEFAKKYGEKGLNEELIKQLFFNDMFADADKVQKIKEPFTVYTRLQKAGAPSVFANTYGFEQKDIAGKAIAGSDEHLLKAILRDSTAISYLPLSLVFDHASGKPVNSLTILPVDLNGNGKVSDDEKFFDLKTAIEKIEAAGNKEIKNLAIGYLHLSVPKDGTTPEAADFLKYVVENGNNVLHEFGYLVPEESKVDRNTFKTVASTRE
jgi:phosphate transport system substrate-binding protein